VASQPNRLWDRDAKVFRGTFAASYDAQIFVHGQNETGDSSDCFFNYPKARLLGFGYAPIVAFPACCVTQM
jgi:hypothetical protein